MKKLLLWTAFCFIGTTGCMVEEQGCATNEDCGDKWVCDPATGACIPAEESDAACSDCSCPDYCNGHGSCSEQYGYPECTCDTGYAGSWCQQCDYAWQDHDGDGICEKDDCAHATAPGTGWLDCGDHGVCDDWGGDVPADCDCDTYWVDMNGECDYCFASDPNDC